MPFVPFACANCGFWQKTFAPPTTCPVCTDFRHTPPGDGPFTFLTPAQVAAGHRCVWNDEPDANGIITFRNEPRLGTIGPNGYLVPHPMAGNVLFECTGWYSPEALDFLAARGGVRWLAASHPHAYGALWQLQTRFPDAATAVQTADLPWTNGFRATRPFDDRLELAPGLELRHVGGHFAGQAVLWWAERRLLFAGDMLKFHFDAAEDDGDGQTMNGISTHKAFNRRVPMSHAEVRRYREVVETLDFTQVYTTFEHAPAGTRESALRLFDAQLAGAPFFGPMTIR